MMRGMVQTATRPLSERFERAIAAAIADNGRAADGRAVRRDGWTPQRIRTFLEALAGCGSVTRAAAAAGVSARGAYKFRRRAQGRGFDRAWALALDLARPAAPVDFEAAFERVTTLFRNGKAWGERRWFDGRKAMAVLTRLDRLALAWAGRTSPFDEADFDTLVDRACAEAGRARRWPVSHGNRESCELSAVPDAS